MEYAEFQKLVWRYGEVLAERALNWWQSQPAKTKALILKNKQAQYCMDNAEVSADRLAEAFLKVRNIQFQYARCNHSCRSIAPKPRLCQNSKHDRT